jgi:hypothetical protein
VAVKWSVYKARRRINLAAFVPAQKIRGYDDFLRFCFRKKILPIPEDDFRKEFEVFLVKPKPVKKTTAKKAPPKPEANGTEAVEPGDEQPPAVAKAPRKKRISKKKVSKKTEE